MISEAELEIAGAILSPELRRQLAAALRPTNKYVIIAGDSPMARAVVKGTYTQRNAANGFLYWLHTLVGRRFTFDGTFAAGGSTVAQMIEEPNLSNIANHRAAVVVVASGGNSIDEGLTGAAIIAQWEVFLTRMWSVGKIVVMRSVQPRAAAQAFTGDKLKALMQVRAWQLAQRGRPGVIVIGLNSFWDQASAEGYPAAGVLDPDGIHPNQYGSFLTALEMADAFRLLYPAGPSEVVTPIDLYDATLNPRGCLNNNPTFTGSVASANFPGGFLATGVTGNGTSLTTGGASVTVSASKETVDGISCQKIGFDGTAVAASTINIEQSISSTKLVAGDVIEGEVHLDIPAGNIGVREIRSSLRFVLDSQAHSSQSGTVGSETGSTAGSFAHKGPRIILPTTIPTGFSTVSIRTEIVLIAGAVSGFVRIGQMAARKVF